MSRPWQFSEDGGRSPFDRQAANPSAQPPSFKTNVNRNKTKKWTEAKNYTYDGDDWGDDYDPYNEYGSYDNEGSGAAAAAAPLPAASSLRIRKNSFERGDETRSFSAGFEQPQTPQKYTEAQPKPSSASRTPQDGGSARGPYDIRRDFTQPAHVPPPLRFGGGSSPSPAHPPMPASQSGVTSPGGGYYPPRKSSLSSGSPLPAAVATELPTSPTPKSAVPSGAAASKPLPFIRPSDIYKRMNEEKEKERRSSESSSRPSMDSIHGRSLATDPGRAGSRERRPSLDPVSEDREHAFQGFAVDNPVLANAIGAGVASDPTDSLPSTSPSRAENSLSADRGTSNVLPVSSTLPPVSRVASGFGSDFWGASELTQTLPSTDHSHPPVSTSPGADAELTHLQPETAQRPLEHQPSLGFRSVVHQAFDRPDDSSASIPATPISRDGSQSQHGSDTAGISPIMSRVPSSSHPESRARAAMARDAAVPPIAEESLPGSPAHSRTTSAEAVPASFTPGYRRSLDPPSQEGSPGRTPELEFTKRLSHPLTAESASGGPLTFPPGAFDKAPSTTSDPTKMPPTDFAKRESDIAEDASSPDRSSFGVAQAAQAARTQFLQNHSPVLPSSPSFPRPSSRGTSPSAGRQSPGGASRVRELAGQYDHIQAVSRTNSSLSSHSKSSVQSWERSDENLVLNRASTFESTKSGNDELNLPQHDNAADQATPSRPEVKAGHSFRPHLPGEWVSFNTAAGTSSSEDVSGDSEVTPRKSDFLAADKQSMLGSPDTPRVATSNSGPVDFTPSTSGQKAHQRNVSSNQGGAIDAVKAAGDALGTALMASVGLGGGHDSKDFAEPQRATEAPSVAPQDPRRPSVGNIYLRPLAEDRAASSVGSSVAPTPPAKDTPKGPDLETSTSSYFPRPVVRLQPDSYSTDNSPIDTESDRLRREIERQLTPQPPHNPQLPLTPGTVEQKERDQDALDGPANLRELQADISPPATGFAAPSLLVAQPTPDMTKDTKPSFLGNRFSWEKRAETSEPLFATEDTEPRMPYERPRSSQGLHIVNTNISSDSDAESPVATEKPLPPIVTERQSGTSPAELEAAPVGALNIHSPVSPITTPHVYPSIEGQSRDVSALPSPSVLPQQNDDMESVLPEPIAEPSEHAHVTPPTSADGPRIPPFREILAIKSTPERISKFNDTRDQFATTDTGLTNWLTATLSSNPEHAHLATAGPRPPMATSTTNGSVRRKVTGPNIMKIARNLGPSSSKDTASPSALTGPEATSSPTPARQGSVSQSGTEKMQAKGKDFMKTAGVFGGKASVGAKGLFAKAKGKLREGGGEKVE